MPFSFEFATIRFRFIKALAFFSLSIALFAFAGCTRNASSPTEEE